MLGKLSSDGIWVKGKDESRGEQQYYIGVSKTRLPLQAVAGAKPIEIIFEVLRECAESGDPFGVVVPGIGKNILKRKKIMTESGKAILSNNSLLNAQNKNNTKVNSK